MQNVEVLDKNSSNPLKVLLVQQLVKELHQDNYIDDMTNLWILQVPHLPHTREPASPLMGRNVDRTQNSNSNLS